MITVRYQHDQDSPTGSHQIRIVARDTLLRFSRRASQGICGRNYFFVKTEAPKSAVQHVLDWMIDQADAKSPSPIPVPDRFEDIVWVYQVCRDMRVYGRFFDEELLQRANAYIRTNPLTFKEFTMVFEVWPGLKELAKKQTEQRFARDGVSKGVPDWEKIVKYCQENGIELKGADGHGEGEERAQSAGAVSEWAWTKQGDERKTASEPGDLTEAFGIDGEEEEELVNDDQWLRNRRHSW